MNTRRLAILLCCLLSGLTAPAQPGPRAAAPDSAFVQLGAAQVYSEARPPVGGTRRWRYRPGQPPGWASPATNDQAWPLAYTSFLYENGPPGWRGTGCFRLHFTLAPALLGQPLGLHIGQDGASEIYLDGRLLGRYGTIGAAGRPTRGVRPRYCLLPFVLREPGPHLLAVRYAKPGAWPLPYGGLTLWVAPVERLVAERVRQARSDALSLIAVTSAGVLAVLHCCLFFFYRSQRANLYFSLFMAVAAGTFLMVFLRATFMSESLRWWTQLGFQVGASLSSGLLLVFLYAVCRTRLPWAWLGLLALTSAGQVAWWLTHPTDGNQVPAAALGVYGLAWLDMLRVLGRALGRQPGTGLLLVGTLGALLVPFTTSSAFHVVHRLDSAEFLAAQLAIQLCGLVLPVCMSVYLARDFAATRRHLEVQLRQVEQLSAQNLAQETERRQLISAQNERLEATVRARTAEISQQNHTLAAQRDEISAQADQLRALDQEKTRFFINITHEFRTLMLGPAAQIAADSREPATRQQAELVQHNAQRLLLLINQLLDLGRLEAGQQALHLARGEVVSLVRGVVNSFELLARQRGIGYTFEADPPALAGAFDADKLEKVLANLLANAFKFTPNAGVVVVQLRAETPPEPTSPRWVELTVRDTGCGIAPADLPHVFDRFYQADNSPTRAHEGTGIGLALAKELVELHGGTIALASEVGRGTSVVVRLPLAAASSSPAAAVSSSPAAPTAPAELAALPVFKPALSAAPLAAPLLLVIEDNADVRAYLRTILTADYQLVEADNGAAGVAVAVEHLPDVVLTDAMMPSLDGFGVCRALKQDERTSHIPIILLTAKADLPSKLQGLDTGADAYLTKPFLRTELLAQLRNLVRGRQQLQAAYRHRVAALPPPALPTSEQAFLHKVHQMVERFLDDETLSVETLSRELGLSRTQLHRKLKALTDQAPGDLIRLIRLQRAHELLAGGRATVAEVAYQVGYGNPANFSTSFSRYFGYAPSSTPRHVRMNSTL